MNLYKLHKKPKELFGYKKNSTVPIMAAIDAYDPTDGQQQDDDVLFNIVEKIDEMFGGKRIEAFEKRILAKKENGKAIMSEYAKTIIKGRWPEAEQYIKQDGYEWREYESMLDWIDDDDDDDDDDW